MTLLRKTVLWLLLLLLCLVCGHARTAEAPTPAREAAVPATSEPTAAVTATPTPTATLEPTPAPTEAPTPEPTAEPTPTPAPTFCPASPAPFLKLRKTMVPTENGRYLDKLTGQRYRFGNFGKGALGFYRMDEESELSYGTAPQPLEDFLVPAYAPRPRPRRTGSGGSRSSRGARAWSASWPWRGNGPWKGS